MHPIHPTGSGLSEEEFSKLRLSKGVSIKSTDPIKPAVMAKLKELSKGTKVTNVRYHGGFVFSGDCMIARKGGEALRLGRFVVHYVS